MEIKRDGHVRLLPLHIANKLAAGEVVERPASVAKELLENSIDAGATRIDVSVEQGGRKLISVRDNGCGMSRDDALLSLERQATSKITEVEDIEHITTLGFRGEAIPSIASVSRMTIRTRRTEDDAGTLLAIAGGQLLETRDIGTAVGTEVEVRDLFFNVPVRRKFLRAKETEFAHIKNTFNIHALAHPELGLSLSADGRQLCVLPPGATLLERAAELFGREFVENLRHIDYEENRIRVHGLAATPALTRSDRSEQYIFVNKRPATAPVIAYALREAYPPMRTREKPILLLFIDVPPETVDVNVHPTKREVRFTQPTTIREAVIRAISSAITTGVQIPLPPVPQEPVTYPAPTPAPLPPSVPPPPSIPVPVAPQGEGLTLPGVSQGAEGAPWKWSRVVGQLANQYIVLETDSGFVLVDPKASVERVLYERLMDNMQKSGNLSQQLLLPESVRLPPADANRLRRHLDAMRKMGFAIEDFGNDHFKVEALPSVTDMEKLPVRELLANIAQDFEQGGIRRGQERWQEEVIARAVCHTSLPLAMKLRPEDAQRLVDALGSCRMPYTSPRGRPTMVFTSFRELERKFGR